MTAAYAASPLLGTVDRAASAVRLERALPAHPPQVWAALTDPARLHAWLAPVQEGAPGPGARLAAADAQQTAAVAAAGLGSPRWRGFPIARPPRHLSRRRAHEGREATARCDRRRR